jgi:hypothetical protein
MTTRKSLTCTKKSTLKILIFFVKLSGVNFISQINCEFFTFFDDEHYDDFYLRKIIADWHFKKIRELDFDFKCVGPEFFFDTIE